MGMHLNARTSSGEIALWQTPTQISYTILPEVFPYASGAKAREALLRYAEYVKYSTNGSWENMEDLLRAQQRAEEHLAYIRGFLDERTLRVWVM